MLIAYMDESGNDKDQVILAGFYGDEAQWSKLEREWKKESGNRNKFHLKELRSWRRRTQEFLARLGPIPNRCGLIAIYSTVKFSDYADLIKGDTHREKVHRAYTVALMPLLLRVMSMIPQDQKIKFIFEQQDQYERFVRMTFEILKKARKAPNGEPRLMGPEFVPKGSTMRLFPAEYLAYALAHIYQNPLSIKSRCTAPIILANVNRAISGTPSREQVREVIGQLKKNKS